MIRRMTVPVLPNADARRLFLHLHGLGEAARRSGKGRGSCRTDRPDRLRAGRQHQHGRTGASHDPVRAPPRLPAQGAEASAGAGPAPVRTLDPRCLGPARVPVPVLAAPLRPRRRTAARKLAEVVPRRVRGEVRRDPEPHRPRRPGHLDRCRRRRGARQGRLVGLASVEDRTGMALAHRAVADHPARRLPEGL